MHINKLKKEFTIEQWEAVIGVCAIEKIYKELLMRYIQLMYELVHHPYKYKAGFHHLKNAFQSLTQSLPYEENVIAPILELRDYLFPAGTNTEYALLQGKSPIGIHDRDLFKSYMDKVDDYISIVSEVLYNAPYTVSEVISFRKHSKMFGETFEEVIDVTGLEESDDFVVAPEEVYSLIRRIEILRRVESANVHISLANAIRALEYRLLYRSYTDRTEEEVDIHPRQYYYRLSYKPEDKVGRKENFTNAKQFISVNYNRKDVLALLDYWRHTDKKERNPQAKEYYRIFCENNELAVHFKDVYYSWIKHAPNKTNVFDFARYFYRTQLPAESPEYLENIDYIEN